MELSVKRQKIAVRERQENRLFPQKVILRERLNFSLFQK